VDDEEDEYAGPRDVENEQRDWLKGEKSEAAKQVAKRSPQTRSKPEYSRTKSAQRYTGEGEAYTAVNNSRSPGNVAEDQESNPNLHGFATFLSKKGMSEDDIGQAIDLFNKGLPAHQNHLGSKEDFMMFLASKGVSPEDIHQACQIAGFEGGAQDCHEEEPMGQSREVAQAAAQRLAPEGGRSNVGYGQSDQNLSSDLQNLVALVNALVEPQQQDQAPMMSGAPPMSTPPTASPAPMQQPAQDSALVYDEKPFRSRYPNAPGRVA